MAEVFLRSSLGEVKVRNEPSLSARILDTPPSFPMTQMILSFVLSSLESTKVLATVVRSLGRKAILGISLSLLEMVSMVFTISAS